MRHRFLSLCVLAVVQMSCGPETQGPEAKATLSVVLAQENGLVLKLRYPGSEIKVPIVDQQPFRVQNDKLRIKGLITISERSILDIKLFLETKRPVKVEFIGFPESAILKDERNVAAVSTVPSGPHQYRVTYSLQIFQQPKPRERPDDDDPDK